MTIRSRLAGHRDVVRQALESRDGAFWLRWGVCGVLLLTALVTGGASFVVIGLGGVLGCIFALMLGAMSEFRTGDGRFVPGNAGMAILSFGLAGAAFALPGKWSVVLGCLVSAGLLLALLLRRLDRETGMNIQTGLWLCGVAAALLLMFLYTGPYAVGVSVIAFAAAAGLYGWMLAALRQGAEVGLRAAWLLALGVGIAVLSGAAFHKLEVAPVLALAFQGFVVGVAACLLFAPLKRLTCWIACKLDEEKEPEW